jgi:hypothetical protein
MLQGDEPWDYREANMLRKDRKVSFIVSVVVSVGHIIVDPVFKTMV